jgi:hypothetical protein
VELARQGDIQSAIIQFKLAVEKSENNLQKQLALMEIEKYSPAQPHLIH